MNEENKSYKININKEGDDIENYYEILHVANFAEIEVVKAAYKAMTKLYHPDVNKDVDSTEMVKINLAYEVLGNVNKKKEYDIKLKTYLNSEQKQKKDPSREREEFEEMEISKHVTSVGKFTKMFTNSLSFIVGAFVDELHRARKETENAYYKGCDMSDEMLVKKYLRSQGSQRNGYAQALIDRGLLYKENGRLVPSYTFRKIVK